MVAPPSDGVPSQGDGKPKKPGRRKRPKSPAISGPEEAGKTKPSPPIPRVAGPDATSRLLAVEAIDNGSPQPSSPSSLSLDIGEEESAIIADERPKLREALEEFRDRAQEVEEKISQLTMRAAREAEEDPGPREDGASFLAAKQLLLMSYCKDLCSYAGGKVAGESLQEGGTCRRLLELRTVMEKLRPLERKLKYQTDKFLRIAAAPVVEDDEGAEKGGDGDDDPLSFRPRPEAMIPWGGEALPENGSLEGKAKGGRRVAKSADRDGAGALYRAPRISSMRYDEEDARGGSSARERKQLEKSRQRVRRGEVMETLREEYGHQPEAVRGGAGNAGVSGISGAKLRKLAEDDREKLQFEEEHMVRLTMSRKKKKARARIEKDAGRLETIADVGSSADFVRVARDADGFARKAGYGEDGDGGGDSVFGKKRKKTSGALTMAMGPVGRSMHGAKGKRRWK